MDMNEKIQLAPPTDENTAPIEAPIEDRTAPLEHVIVPFVAYAILVDFAREAIEVFESSCNKREGIEVNPYLKDLVKVHQNVAAQVVRKNQELLEKEAEACLKSEA